MSIVQSFLNLFIMATKMIWITPSACSTMTKWHRTREKLWIVVTVCYEFYVESWMSSARLLYDRWAADDDWSINLVGVSIVSTWLPLTPSLRHCQQLHCSCYRWLRRSVLAHVPSPAIPVGGQFFRNMITETYIRICRSQKSDWTVEGCHLNERVLFMLKCATVCTDY